MLNQEKINVLKQEFSDKASGLVERLGYRKKIDDNFLSIKLAFTAFLGVIFAITIDKVDIFGQNILTILTIIIFCTFFILLHDLWEDTSDSEKALESQYRRTILAKIRHIAVLEKDTVITEEYGKKAETLLMQTDNVRQKMLSHTDVEEIIKYPKESRGWKKNFILWAFLFLSVPVLFLLKLLNFL